MMGIPQCFVGQVSSLVRASETLALREGTSETLALRKTGQARRWPYGKPDKRDAGPTENRTSETLALRKTGQARRWPYGSTMFGRSG
jgi:hypothetical protein